MLGKKGSDWQLLYSFTIVEPLSTNLLWSAQIDSVVLEVTGPRIAGGVLRSFCLMRQNKQQCLPEAVTKCILCIGDHKISSTSGSCNPIEYT